MSRRDSDLVARAKRHGTPLIEGGQVTFVWRGKTPPALMGDFNLWGGDSTNRTRSPLHLRESAPGVWTHTLNFPDDAYVEYSFTRGGRRVLDPLNRRRTPNGFGATNNYFYMPGASPTPWARRRRNVPRGVVTSASIDTLYFATTRTRRAHFYQPPTRKPALLLVTTDGQDYLRRARLPVLLDNLLADGRIPPVAAVMLENRFETRMLEYAANELTQILLSQNLVSIARDRLNLLDLNAQPGAFGIAGASMGGLTALYTALRVPEVFGRVISQAAPFELWSSRPIVFELARDARVRPERIWMDVGRMDWLLAGNRLMRDYLTGHGYNVKYGEYDAYHNWPAWRDALPDALEWAFGK
jgi:enterochelin esterase family protein